MRFNVLTLVAPALVLASALGCSVAPVSTEGATDVESATTAAGVSASLTVKTS
jgi:hypothetical protein